MVEGKEETIEVEEDLGAEVHKIDPKVNLVAVKKNQMEKKIQEGDLEEEGLIEEENLEGGHQGSS